MQFFIVNEWLSPGYRQRVTFTVWLRHQLWFRVFAAITLPVWIFPLVVWTTTTNILD